VPVIETTQDPATASFTVVTELVAPPERAWRLWADPRQVERWWGPPGYPAAFHVLDLVVGGRAHYTMPNDQGGLSHAFWRVLAVDEPRSLEIENGFANEQGEPDDSFVRSNVFHVDFEPIATGTRMTIVSRFDDAEHLAQMLGYGMETGLSMALGQIDAILAEG